MKMTNNFCHCCLVAANGSISREPFLIMKDHSFIYNNETITFLDGYLDINNCTIEELFPCSTISDSLICGLCVAHLESAYVFRELCRQAAIFLRSKYSDNRIIKCEESDEDTDSQNEVSLELLDNVKNEQVISIANGSINQFEHDTENLLEPTCITNVQKKIGHRRKRHKQKAKKFSCSHCLNIYGTREALLDHNKATHLGILYKCEECPKIYKYAKTLLVHKKTAHLGISYKCKECPKIFKYASDLFRHKNSIHLGLSYKCKECPKIFAQSMSLKHHTDYEHLNLKYTCDICSKTFHKYESINEHINRVHLNKA